MGIRKLVCLWALCSGTTAFSAAMAEGLEGTAWRLVNIASMDDSVYLPEDRAKYTLAFGADGRVALGAGCNRGTGTWLSESPSHVRFGPIASTRALCPPPSISDRYLAQFEWVRTYTMKEGHLFLATMADGSIIEFEPLPPVVATAFGEEIHAASAAELQEQLNSRLFDHYAAERGIDVAQDELDAFVANMRQGLEAEGLSGEDELTPSDRIEVDAMRRQMGYGLIRHWKINKSLFETYGGRIIYQQWGPEALDAVRAYFEERQKAGDFTISDPAMAEAFWQYFTDESRHEFMAPGGKDEQQAFTQSPWKEER